MGTHEECGTWTGPPRDVTVTRLVQTDQPDGDILPGVNSKVAASLPGTSKTRDRRSSTATKQVPPLLLRDGTREGIAHELRSRRGRGGIRSQESVSANKSEVTEPHFGIPRVSRSLGTQPMRETNSRSAGSINRSPPSSTAKQNPRHINTSDGLSRLSRGMIWSRLGSRAGRNRLGARAYSQKTAPTSSKHSEWYKDMIPGMLPIALLGSTVYFVSRTPIAPSPQLLILFVGLTARTRTTLARETTDRSPGTRFPA